MNTWIGKPADVEAALVAAGAAEDSRGQFLFEGPKAQLVHGRGDDLKIDERTFYFVRGEKKCLLDLVRGIPGLDVQLVVLEL